MAVSKTAHDTMSCAVFSINSEDLTYEDLPSDHYLRLAGKMRQLLGHEKK